MNTEINRKRMSEFNSDNHYVYYCGARIPLKKWNSPQTQQESEM